MRNLLEKSRPPVSKPTGGMRMSLTSELMMPPKAAPIITPTARSTAFPLIANSLNSFSMMKKRYSICDYVDKFFRDDHDFANGFAGNQRLDLWIVQRSALDLFLIRQERHVHSVAHL